MTGPAAIATVCGRCRSAHAHWRRHEAVRRPVPATRCRGERHRSPRIARGRPEELRLRRHRASHDGGGTGIRANRSRSSRPRAIGRACQADGSRGRAPPRATWRRGRPRAVRGSVESASARHRAPGSGRSRDRSSRHRNERGSSAACGHGRRVIRTARAPVQHASPPVGGHLDGCQAVCAGRPPRAGSANASAASSAARDAGVCASATTMRAGWPATRRFNPVPRPSSIARA